MVLLSGGLDSATALAVARAEGFLPHALTFRYGQRHIVELESAQRVAAAAGVGQHLVLDVALDRVGGSALTDGSPVPHSDSVDHVDAGIPTTYVPARNTVFLSYALAWSETLGCSDVYIGVNALDYSGYPDCRPEYLEAFERMANLATRASVESGARTRVHAPLVSMTKAEIILLGTSLGVDYSLTHSCYDPAGGESPCGTCDACLFRAKGFAEAGLVDPAVEKWRHP